MGYICKVKKGNLLDEQSAIFMVNASNTALVLGSGVSAAFKERCGKELQDEMTAKLQSLKQKLKKGDVVATTSAKSNSFSYTLHAAVMDYNQGVRGYHKSPTLEDISQILYNIEAYLQWYSNHHEKPLKLVLPLLGCGIGGLNVEEVISIYQQFFLRDVSFFCEVVIYAYSDEHYVLLHKYLSE